MAKPRKVDPKSMNIGDDDINKMRARAVKAEAERDEALRACKAAFDSINRFPGSLHDRAMTKLEKVLRGRNLDWRDHDLLAVEAEWTRSERDKERLVEALKPFAVEENDDHARTVRDGDPFPVYFRAGDIRRARALIEEFEKK